MEKIEIGKVLKTHGIKGELKIVSITDNAERMKDIKEVYILNDKLNIKKIKFIKNSVIVSFQGINDINEVEKYVGEYVSIDRENAIPLEEEQYFIADLLDCILMDKKGNEFGKITSIDNYGGGDVVEFKKMGQVYNFIFDVNLFEKIDVENKKIIVKSEKFKEVIV